MTDLHPQSTALLQQWLAQNRPLKPVPCGFVHPCDGPSLRGALDAAAAGISTPCFIGPRHKLVAVAEANGLSLDGHQIIDVPHSHAAADMAAQLALKGELRMLAKGSLHTDEMLRALLLVPALRTKRRVSHVFRFEVPAYGKPLMITDAAINLQPTLEDKADIVANAIDLAHALGIALPKVAILAAVETVSSRMPSTLDAAALCKMADRGQISGALLDGPLAFDNAISPQAAATKGIESRVAGDADILVAPDLEAGNMLAKLLEHLGGAAGCGVVLGLRLPLALTSRADNALSRMASCALAARMVTWYETHSL